MINTEVEDIKAINSAAYKLFIEELDNKELDKNEMDMKELKNRTKEQIDELINSIDNNSSNKSYFSPQISGWDDNEIINSKMDKYNPDLFYINKSTNQ